MPTQSVNVGVLRSGSFESKFIIDLPSPLSAGYYEIYGALFGTYLKTSRLMLVKRSCKNKKGA